MRLFMFIWNNMHQLLICHKTCSKEVHSQFWHSCWLFNSQFWHHVDFICYLWDCMYISTFLYFILYWTVLPDSCFATHILFYLLFFCFLLVQFSFCVQRGNTVFEMSLSFVRQCKSFRKKDVSEVFKKMLDVSLSKPCISSHVWDPV